MPPRFRSPLGTQDVLPEDAPRWRAVERAFREVCAIYGYQEVRTPTFEATELFVRAVGEHTDIVGKEMYSVQATRGEGDGGDTGRLTLRPEGTAPALRAYLQHSLGARAPLTKLYYIAANFRHERPQSGRLREHHQCGVEALGSDDPLLDAEVVALGLSYLERLGLREHRLELNTVGCAACRPAFRSAVRERFAGVVGGMCENCRRRYDTNPLRMLDCKREDWHRLGSLAPDILDFLCQPCKDHFTAVQSALQELALPYERNPRLVRGLDYYVRTTFEVLHPGLGAQSTIVAGGRYDGLVEALGGAPTPGIGFGSGIERVLLALQAEGVELPADLPRGVFLVAMAPSARLPVFRLAARLRAAGIPAELDYLGRAWRKQMREAGRTGARAMLLVGEDELAANTVVVKDLDTGDQQIVAQGDIPEHLRARFGYAPPTR